MKLKWAMLLPVFMLLAGCEERYRYPCQDPDNWDEKQCKKPYCSANGTCPEDLTHYERKNLTYNEKGAPVLNPAPSQPSKGECK
jgi:hypothetical protein